MNSSHKYSRTELSTNRVYKYAHSVWESSGKEAPIVTLFLDVKAESDCHLWLGSSTEKGYEIVIGGWRNRRSEIRRGKQGAPLSTVFHSSVDAPLKGASKSAKFWISFLSDEANTTLVVGRGWDLWKEKFLVALDVNKKRIKGLTGVSVSTGFGAEGHWVVYVDDLMAVKENQPMGNGDTVIGDIVKERTANDAPEVKNSYNTPISQTPVKFRQPPTTPLKDTVVVSSSSSWHSSGLLKRPRAGSVGNIFLEPGAAAKRSRW